MDNLAEGDSSFATIREFDIAILSSHVLISCVVEKSASWQSCKKGLSSCLRTSAFVNREYNGTHHQNPPLLRRLDFGVSFGSKDAQQGLASLKEPWLLVLDNADSPNVDYQQYFPAGASDVVILISHNAEC